MQGQGGKAEGTVFDELFLGVDVGSVSLDTAVVNEEGGVLEARYVRTRGRPLETALLVLEEIFGVYPRQKIRALSLTGAGAPLMAKSLNGLVVNEIIALTRACGGLHPDARTIIDMGGEDAKLILTSPDGRGGLRIEDFAMNTMCAAGTGSFLDQQAHRLKLTIEEFSEIAQKSENPPRLAGRCSVFAKSDMIHLQQEATPDYDIVAGLCFAMARNLKSNIAKGKQVAPPVCFTGGVAANRGVHRALKEIMGLNDEDLIVPEHFGCMGAIGAALTARDQEEKRAVAPLDALRRKAAAKGRETARLPVLKWGEHHKKGLMELDVPKGPLSGYLGVDVGSISTNVVVIDENGGLLSKQYLMTAGRPLEAVKEGLRLAGEEIGDRVTILGAGTTGSGRYLTADFIGADIVRNEITAQATAAAFIDPDVDTIFEIGGQDSKYISIKDSAIVNFMMNKVCAAGTGSFLEEQAEKLGISIRNQFGDLALSSEKPVRMGERCTVFMESDLVSHQAAGEQIPDLVAGLSYSIVYNYLNKVVEERPVGERIFYQGATAANRGIVAAFESVLGRKITVPPHHDVTGAIGAALLAMRERNWKESGFKGFEISRVGYEISTFECKGCPNACSIRKVTVAGEKRPLYYGSRCEKYDVDKKALDRAESMPDLFAEREELMLSYLDESAPAPGGEIGIPRTMFYREMLPFFSAFCRELGFRPVVSGPTTKTLIHRGVESVVNEPCFPIKVAHGHMHELIDKGVKRILMPSFINFEAPGHPLGYGQACPYVQTLPYTIPAAFDFEKAGVEIITAPVRLGFGERVRGKDLKLLAMRMGAKGGVARAIEAGLAAQADFYEKMKARGREVIDGMGPDDLAMVVVSRPYNGGDPGINLGLPRKMQSLNVYALPQDYLDLDDEMGASELAEMYWRFGQKILAAARVIRRDPRLYGVYITNFGCGPDSFIEHFFRQAMEGKPFLEIEIDEHSADVGAITRLEAFLDSLRNAPPKPFKEKPARRRNLRTGGRRIYIPPMTDHSHAVAAAFRACGQEAEVLPESDERTLELGRKFSSGKECYPCALTAGDMMKLLWDAGVDPDQAAFFMPSGTGPCRFGQYHRFHRMVLDENGFESVPIYAPDQSDVFYEELGMAGDGDFARLGWKGVVAVDMIQKALHETRPYEKEKGATDKVYADQLARIAASVQSGGDLMRVMREAREDFGGIARTNGQKRPRVGIVGEIYTRANRFANEDIVRGVEDLGGEAWQPSIGEWILYINFTGSRRARIMRRYKSYLGTRIKNYVQLKDEHNLGRPWQGYLETLHEPVIEKTLEMAGDYLHHTYEGEAVLSLGKSRDMYYRGAGGVINVIPFTCMPGTIVNALMKRFRENHGNMPFLAMSMDGQEATGSRVRLEAFMHQVREFTKTTGQQG